MKKAIALSFAVLGIQACSSSAPSTSDVVKALKSSMPANCTNLSFENVKLLNGMKIDDLNHQVHVNYDLKMTPLPDSQIEENKKKQEAYGAIGDALRQKSMELHEENEKVNDLPDGPDKDEQEKTMRAKWDALKQEGSSAAKPTTLDEEWGGPTCISFATMQLAQIGAFISPPDMETKGGVVSFDAKFVMQKSDNGWVKAE